MAYGPCSTSTSGLGILEVHHTTNDTSVPALPGELDVEDMIDTLRLLSLINSTLRAPPSSTPNLSKASSRPASFVDNSCQLCSLRPAITNFPHSLHLPLPSSVLFIPVFKDGDESDSGVAALLPILETAGCVLSTVENNPFVVLDNTPITEPPPRPARLPIIERAPLPIVDVPVPGTGIPSLPPCLVLSSPQSSQAKL